MSEPTVFYADDAVTLWHGDMRCIVPTLDLRADLIVADPPYGETSLEWDRWPAGWVRLLASAAPMMWCFGSLRLHGLRFMEFLQEGWAYSQDIVWEKHNGSGFHADRFRRVHEQAVLWYRGRWSERYHQVPTTPDAVRRTVRRKERPAHMGDIQRGSYQSEDGGPRMMRSVIAARSMHHHAIHPTEKPIGLLDPLIRYACPPGGTVLDPFAGSGSTAEAARLSGRKAVLVEAREDYCRRIVSRLSQTVIPVASGATDA